MQTGNEAETLIRIAYGSDCQVRVQPQLAQLYRQLSALLWSLLTEKFQDQRTGRPEVLVVHSPSARAMTIQMSGLPRYLVYDQYLGQVFNKLTRLALEDASTSEVDAYLMKLFAQRAYVSGDFRSAAAMGIAARARRPPATSPEEGLARRSRLVLAQEAFIIAHEMVHTLLAADATQAEARGEWYSSLMREVHNLPFTLTDAPEVADPELVMARFAEYEATSVTAAFRRRGVEYEAKPRSREYSEMVAERKGLLEATLSESALLEECLCDAFAFGAAVEALSAWRVPPAEVSLGAVMALHNLRIVQLLDRHAAGQLGSEIAVSDYFVQSVMRLSLLRSFVLASFHLSGEGQLSITAHQEATEFNERHSAAILDQLLYCFEGKELVDRLGSVPAVAEACDDLQGNSAILRHVLGFPDTRPEV